MSTQDIRCSGVRLRVHRSGDGAPLLLINPDQIYDDLLRPSLFELWLSQLVTFAVYPRFVARHGGRVGPAVALAAGASALAVYGLWTTIATASISF